MIVAFLDRLTGYSRERYKFYKAHGYKLNLKNPKSLNEKIVYKKIYDRSDLIPYVADKLNLFFYMEQKLGSDLAKKYHVKKYWQSDKHKEIPYDDLPNQFVLKSNHGSGNNYVVWDKSKIDNKEIENLCFRWLKKDYGVRSHEWAYTKIKRKIFAEKLLLTDDMKIPKDYKFHMMNGECHLIQVDVSRFSEFKRNLYDKDWNFLSVKWKRECGEGVRRPGSLDEMLFVAKKLSEDFDYIRVDFFLVGDNLYVGELTNYPARGLGKITPTSFDYYLGDQWTLFN